MIYYLIGANAGLNAVDARNDGYTINISWFKPYSSDGYELAQNIYYSTSRDTLFSEGIKYVYIDGYENVDIPNLTPGQLYYFCARPVEYDSIIVDANALPNAYDNLKVYAQNLLRSDITSSQLTIPLLDVTDFPDFGVIQVGAEYIQYLSADRINNNLVLSSITQRGVWGTVARSHTTDGYDGYNYYDPTINYVLGKESSMFDQIYSGECRFDWQEYSFNVTDGYKQVTKDILTTDLSGSDEYNQDFNSYDYDGWHRTDPVLLLSGGCVGSYLSGEQFCADGYDGVGRMLRGIPLQERILQRQEYMLNITGEPVALIRRQRTGIVCSCYLSTGEYPDDRCPKCLGTKYVIGYEQYFNPKRSDGRIMVRFSPADEDLKMQEAGMESELITDCWTLTVPTVKDRDILVRFDQNDNEEFRYEVLTVNRNRTALRLEGAQKMRVQRIRKFDTAYKIKAFRNTSTEPVSMSTTITNAFGIGPHKHNFVYSATQSPDKMNQLTSIVQGHNHEVMYDINTGKLIVLEVLGHSHNILI